MFQNSIREEPLHKSGFNDKVLNWVLKMQTGPTQFSMSEGTDSTIFTSCFALFIFDLFGIVDTWTERERRLWIDYLHSFQDEESGYFVPDSFDGDFNSKPVHQLTCFCLSALNILGDSPKYKFSFIKQWPHPEDIYEYLKNSGCFTGKPGSGNTAMFLAIFLTYQYERYKDESALERLNTWFDCHEKEQNRLTGFWGNSLNNKHYAGFQNAFHQFVIYNYWKRPVPHYRNITDKVLSLQVQDGYFGPVPGGGGCWDFDAADILINCGYKMDYRKKDIETALIRLFSALRKNQNDDGGFCESRKRLSRSINIIGRSNFIFSDLNPYHSFLRFKATLRESRSNIMKTHWVKIGHKWNHSDLWNTWFRCLTLAEIVRSISFDNSLSNLKWKFHNTIGLGYFNNKD